ncbi:MAG TPA: hypothetical protein VJT67_12120 [Longimicrobiaceae bacterium]|nr:hypothetical protein [Longimicrobiaceae bacterium]
MSRSIELSDEVYATLEAAASAAGVTPTEWVTQHINGTATHGWPRQDLSPEVLRERFLAIVGSDGNGDGEGAKRMTLAERIVMDPEPFYSARGDLAERHSELFAEGMLEKRRMGTL